MNRLAPKSILLARVKIHLSWKMVLSGPHGCIGIALILEDGKSSFHLSVFGSLLRKLRIGCWITRIVYWSKEWTWASLHREWNRERAIEMCPDFVFVRICWNSILMSCKPVELSRIRFLAKLSTQSRFRAQTIKTS